MVKRQKKKKKKNDYIRIKENSTII